MRSILSALLGEAGIAPAYALRFRVGGRHVEQVRYRLGDVTILGLLHPLKRGADEVATVT